MIKSLLFALLIVFSFIPYINAQQYGKYMSVSLNKDEYEIGEEIYLQVLYYNNADTNIKIPDWKESEVLQGFTIIDEAGNVTEYQGMRSRVIHRYEPYLLKPGDTLRYKFPLLEYFGNGYPDPIRPSTPRFQDFLHIKPGKYILSNDRKNSDKAEFTVKQPSDKQKEIFSELQRIYALPDETKEEAEKKAPFFEAFLEHYPESAYYDKVFYFLIQLKASKDVNYYSDVASDIAHFIFNRPYSGVAEDLLEYLYESGEQSSRGIGGGENRLRDVIEGHPNHYIRKKAQEIIEYKKKLR